LGASFLSHNDTPTEASGRLPVVLLDGHWGGCVKYLTPA
jgi:hypothetical protein